MPNRVWLTTSHLADIRGQATAHYPMETGGILIGYCAGPGGVVVTRVVEAGEDAQHGRDYFLPDHRHHEREVARLYELSGRLHVYLGDWHSHPRGPAQLSSKDVRTLRRISRSPGARVPRPIMLVAFGAPGTGWKVAAYQLDRAGWFGARVAAAEIVAFEDP